MPGIVLLLAAFYILTSIFSDNSVSEARWKIFAVALVVTVLLITISNANETLAGLAIACAVAALVAWLGLVFWIKVRMWQAVKIAGSYIGIAIGLSLVLALLLGSPTH